MLKVIHDLSARAVRSNLKEIERSDRCDQGSLFLALAAGLTILLNESEEMIDAANDHRGDWAIMQPIYKNGPPSFSLFK